MLRILFLLFGLQQCCSFLILKNASFAKDFDPMESLDIGNGPEDPIPEHWDLRDVGVVSPVKDQMDCAACWAFSVIANMESRLKMYRHEEIILSAEQFLIDCDSDQGGCQNGSIVEAFIKIVAYFRVVPSEDFYPYTNGQGECKIPYVPPRDFDIVGVRKVIGEKQMVLALWLYGPLSAAINSASMKHWNYEEGAIDDPSDDDCSPTQLNHAVLIVGYSVAKTDDGKKIPFWIIKNSWGTDFGDKGFYYLVRGRNACGIASDVSFPIIDI